MAAKKSAGLEQLRLQIKNGELKNLYLFFGEEEYIKNEYVKKVLDMVPEDPFADFNSVKTEGEITDMDRLDAVLENFPMMAEKKTVVIKDSGIFKSASEDVKSFWSKKLSNLADYIVLIFNEKEVDKRGTLYKTAAKNGIVAEFSYLSASDMTNWATSEFMNCGKKISKNNAAYFISLCSEDVSSVKNEIDKLVSYCGDEVLKSDIDRVVSKSLNIRIFELTDSIMEKNMAKAMSVLTELKGIKEPAFRILAVLFSAFDKMLFARLAESDGMLYNDIVSKLGVHPYVAKKYISSARMFNADFLIDRVRAFAQIYYAIRQGEISDWDALENFIAECIYKK